MSNLSILDLHDRFPEYRIYNPSVHDQHATWMNRCKVVQIDELWGCENQPLIQGFND